MSVYRVVVPFWLCLPLWMLGCGKVVEKIQEKVVERAVEKSVESKTGGKVELDISGQKVSSVSKDGKTKSAWGQGVSVPADFPKQVPIYPGSTVVMSNADNTGLPRHSLGLSTRDPGDKVVAYYKNELKTFKIEQEINAEGMHMIIFVDRKQSKLKVQLSVASQNEAESESGLTVALQTEALP